MENEKAPLHLDVEKILNDKSPRLGKLLPGFIIRYLKRIVHQDDINDIIKNHGHLRGSQFNDGALGYMGIKYRAHGLENLPSGGRNIFVSNHPRAFQTLQRNKIPRQ
jgi:hypothetical protein